MSNEPSPEQGTETVQVVEASSNAEAEIDLSQPNPTDSDKGAKKGKNRIAPPSAKRRQQGQNRRTNRQRQRQERMEKKKQEDEERTDVEVRQDDSEATGDDGANADEKKTGDAITASPAGVNRPSIDEKLPSNMTKDPRGEDPTQRIKKRPDGRNRARNTESFDPKSTLVRPDLRVRVASASSPNYGKPLKHDDIIIVPEMFGGEEDWSIYYKLVEEVTQLQNDSTRNTEWTSWHEGAHLVVPDPRGSETFQMVVDKLCSYFGIRTDTIYTRFNWYKDSADWKPFHHDSAAFNSDRAKTQNITVGVSFGASRELAFLRNEKKNEETNGQRAAEEGSEPCRIYFPQPNNGVVTFGRDVNIHWKHGINALEDDHGGKGRVSIILWGLAENVVEEDGSPELLGYDGRGPHGHKKNNLRKNGGRNARNRQQQGQENPGRDNNDEDPKAQSDQKNDEALVPKPEGETTIVVENETKKPGSEVAPQGKGRNRNNNRNNNRRNKQGRGGPEQVGTTVVAESIGDEAQAPTPEGAETTAGNGTDKPDSEAVPNGDDKNRNNNKRNKQNKGGPEQVGTTVGSETGDEAQALTPEGETTAVVENEAEKPSSEVAPQGKGRNNNKNNNKNNNRRNKQGRGGPEQAGASAGAELIDDEVQAPTPEGAETTAGNGTDKTDSEAAPNGKGRNQNKNKNKRNKQGRGGPEQAGTTVVAESVDDEVQAPTPEGAETTAGNGTDKAGSEAVPNDKGRNRNNNKRNKKGKGGPAQVTATEVAEPVDGEVQASTLATPEGESGNGAVEPDSNSVPNGKGSGKNRNNNKKNKKGRGGPAQAATTDVAESVGDEAQAATPEGETTSAIENGAVKSDSEAAPNGNGDDKNRNNNKRNKQRKDGPEQATDSSSGVDASVDGGNDVDSAGVDDAAADGSSAAGAGTSGAETGDKAQASTPEGETTAIVENETEKPGSEVAPQGKGRNRNNNRNKNNKNNNKNNNRRNKQAKGGPEQAGATVVDGSGDGANNGSDEGDKGGTETPAVGTAKNGKQNNRNKNKKNGPNIGTTENINGTNTAAAKTNGISEDTTPVEKIDDNGNSPAIKTDDGHNDVTSVEEVGKVSKAEDIADSPNENKQAVVENEESSPDKEAKESKQEQ